MSGIETGSNELTEQHDALHEYLGSLLTPQSVAETDVAAESDIACVAEPDASAETVECIDPVIERDDTAGPDSFDYTEIPANIMTFKVSGITLGIPLNSFAGVQTLVDEPATESSSKDWYLGRVGEAGTSIQIIDTYRLIVPQARQRSGYLGKPLYGRTIVLAKQGRLGFLCDQTLQVINLADDQVICSSDQTARAWLAGMVKEQGIAILDINQITDWLNQLA